MNDRQKAEIALAEARMHFAHAMELLGREGNTRHFLEIISKYHAALWRWRRATVTPTPPDVNYRYYYS